MTNDEIYNKAINIISDRNKKEKHIRVCINAGICPECGEKLKHLKYGDLPHLVEYENVAELTKCSIDKSHYSNKIYFDNDFDDY